jgi:hypothetical protein
VPVDIYDRGVRRLDLATFTGDAWADDPTLALPPNDATVPRLMSDGRPFRWSIYGMSSGEDDATQVVDTTTSLSTCIITLSRTDRQEPLVDALVATSGTVVGHAFTEVDLGESDVFVVAIPAIAVGTAPWLWIVPKSGFLKQAHGVDI